MFLDNLNMRSGFLRIFHFMLSWKTFKQFSLPAVCFLRRLKMLKCFFSSTNLKSSSRITYRLKRIKSRYSSWYVARVNCEWALRDFFFSLCEDLWEILGTLWVFLRLLEIKLQYVLYFIGWLPETVITREVK